MRNTKIFPLVAAVVVALAGSAVAGGVSLATEPTVIDTTPTSEPNESPDTTEDDVLHYVAFGDSWPEGAHCGGCTTFVGLWAQAIEAQTRRDVSVTNFTGAAEPSAPQGKTSASLLAALQADEQVRDAVRGADIILIATGPNEMDVLGETCNGPDDFDCVRDLGEAWAENFDAILTEIDLLREGNPTAVRLVNAANLFVMVPAAIPEGAADDFATAGPGALVFELLTTAMCDVAEAHSAVCIDVRPLITGPNLDQPGDENSPESMQAITDALVAAGLPEIELPEGVYTSTSFVVPFEVTLPEWGDLEPAVEEPNFVTWEAIDADRGIRFLAPVIVFRPGETGPAPVPDDYSAYLLALTEHGAIFEDVVETTVDGLPATIVTATTSAELYDSLGCPDEGGPLAADCWGLLPGFILRIAVIETDAGPLLVWVRDSSGAANARREYDTFDAMLPSLRFLEPANAGEHSDATITTASTESADGAAGLTARYAGETDAPLGYYEYLPPSYGDGDPSPLLVFLEGFGEHGDGSEAELPLLVATGIPELLASGEWPSERPFVVLAPQHALPDSDEPYAGCDESAELASGCMRVQTEAGHPEGGSVCHTPTEVHDFIAYALDAYDVDPERVYLTGLSCGAYAAYEYVAEHGASQIAAMVPIAGEGRFAWDRAGCALGDVAIWAFHGDADDVVPTAGSIEPLTNLADCPDATDHMLTIYSGVDHDSWTRTYDLSAGHDIYEWLLQHENRGADAGTGVRAAPFTLESPAGSQDADAEPSSYASTSFVVPFEVTLPEWVAPDPAAELPNFVTWEGADVDRGIRFLVPVNVYPPGASSPTAVPEDYLSYLLAQSDHGAVFEDVVETTVDRRPATVLTVAKDDLPGLDGSLGCQEEGVFAADCFGVQPEFVLRMAVIDSENGPPLLIWVRDIRGVDAEYETFDEMLASLRFRAEAPPTSQAPGETPVAAPIDGSWTMNLTRDELANSPLLFDQGELNNQNWGEFTFVFDNGRFVETQHNTEAVWAMTGTYAVDGDVLTLDRDNGEHFVMRWRIDGDTLVLERDDSLGGVPTPFIINPWTRRS